MGGRGVQLFVKKDEKKKTKKQKASMSYNQQQALTRNRFIERSPVQWCTLVFFFFFCINSIFVQQF